ncbi:gamma-tubulin complex, DGRIP84/SPC97 component [Sistotremastrum niveocremeum HHB9708]|uniref:Spindle pole body component n=1 Tax=Sistotremastrum niveocremeum HHB9708 TaxID=1314777 RepID=A0A164YLX4_9AGAM|nr:gamma-tubulin complex, DGRIP84/SPC97 component [Sistotremastrum niveocremeum HHB9708]
MASSIPYTPRTRPSSRKAQVTLSAKQYTKISHTIEAVRRKRGPVNGAIDEDGEGCLNSGLYLKKPFLDNAPEQSFIDERSFVRAPLNSRLGLGPTIAPKAKSRRKTKDNLSECSLELQEAIILEDLLSVLMGIEGTHITFHEGYAPEDADEESLLAGPQFVVDPKLNPSLRDLVERTLPLATHYSSIKAFIELRSSLEFGLVNHALCAALRDMVKEYQVLLAQLESAFYHSPDFTLQKLWFYVHPTLHTLTLLQKLVVALCPVTPPSEESADEESSDDETPGGVLRRDLGLSMPKDLTDSSKPRNSQYNESPIIGGEVLTVISAMMQLHVGDPDAQKVFSSLWKSASVPYARMLRDWMTRGVWRDRWDEGCIREAQWGVSDGIVRGDEEWDKRYTLRDGTSVSSSQDDRISRKQPEEPTRLPGGACIPPEIEPLKHKILLAGKYLNVIRACGGQIKSDFETYTSEDIDLGSDRWIKQVDEAYTYANITLLSLLVGDKSLTTANTLVSRLDSLRHFFFLSQGSFLLHFLDLTVSEMRRSTKSVSQARLQPLMDLALAAEGAPYREDVKVVISTNGALYEWLLKIVSVQGAGPNEVGDEEQREDAKKSKEKEKSSLMTIDALSLDYNVPFPLSLVISRSTLLRYQIIFRFLLHLRHVERSLSSMWIDQKGSVWRQPLHSTTDLGKWRGRVLLLRTRMNVFIQQILAFAAFDILEPSWRAFHERLKTVTTVDDLIRDHVDFLDTCLKGCMLTHAGLLKYYSKAVMTCATFTTYSSSFSKEAGADDTTEAAMEKRWSFLNKFQTNFEHWLKSFADRVQLVASSENVALLPLVTRINQIRPVIPEEPA